ncbi:MAG TPA: S8 family serine peptidase [Longimicrobiales bacterium]|nr:S8 family serine peptidase [Longimicrobiales bacterium]
MRRRRLIALAGLLLPAAASAQGVSRIDPRLRLLARLAPAPVVAGARVPLGILTEAATLRTGADGRVRVDALARVGAGGEDALRAAGARLGARAGDVVSVRVPLDALPALERARGLRYLEAAAPLVPSIEPLPRPAPPFALDAAAATPMRTEAEEADVDRLRQREGDRFLGLAGQGVVIGFVDTGVDLAHADFRLADGATRVLYAWDQTAPGSGPGRVGDARLDYGAECLRADIDAGRCGLRDRLGHGTHVAGIAAGDGSATGKGMAPYRYVGVAPAADLVVVKGGDASISTAGVLDGVAYIFGRAAALGRPAVVNLSLGTQVGPHDGSTLFERALDNLVGPGRIITVAAGNNATNGDEVPAFVRAPIHVSGSVAAGAESRELVVPAYAPAAGEKNDGALVDLWYDGRDSLAVVVTSPGGRSVRALPGDTITLLTPEGAILVDNASGGPSPLNGDREISLGMIDLDAAAPPAAGRWRITLEPLVIRGSGRFHAWLVASTLGPATAPTSFDAAENAYLVASPATAARLISVAAYANRHEWPTAGGRVQAYPFQEPLGDIGHFSDPGPRRDGALKPDITAPGKVVVSAMSRDASTWSALPNYVEADSAHAALLGTSMAAPFVAGAVALLLELRPALTPEAARDLLTASARGDDFTRHPYTGGPDGVPNPQWGYGKLDVAAAVHRLGPPAGTLAVQAEAPQPAGAPSSARGERLVLLRLALAADSAEAEAVERLAVDVVGRDTAARVLLVRDVDGDGAAGADEPVEASAPARLEGAPVTVALAPGPVVPAGARRTYLVAVELSGAAPNGARFQATFRPADLVAYGTLSGAAAHAPGAPVTSAERQTTLLAPGERVNLSENPVRGERLVINFAERPRAVAIYALTGTRVRSFGPDGIEDGRVVWNLENDRGARVAAGVYLVVVELPGGAEVRKIFVQRR